MLQPKCSSAVVIKSLTQILYSVRNSANKSSTRGCNTKRVKRIKENPLFWGFAVTACATLWNFTPEILYSYFTHSQAYINFKYFFHFLPLKQDKIALMFFHTVAAFTFWTTGSLMAVIQLQHVCPDISRWFHLVAIMCCTFVSLLQFCTHSLLTSVRLNKESWHLFMSDNQRRSGLIQLKLVLTEK